MTDINKQIEGAREYRRSLIRRIRLNKANIEYILENGTINGSLMLDIDKAMIDYNLYSSRWRKFGVDDLPKIGRQIICRDGDKYHLSKPISHDGIHWLAEHFIEWKSID